MVVFVELFLIVFAFFETIWTRWFFISGRFPLFLPLKRHLVAIKSHSTTIENNKEYWTNMESNLQSKNVCSYCECTAIIADALGSLVFFWIRFNKDLIKKYWPKNALLINMCCYCKRFTCNITRVISFVDWCKKTEQSLVGIIDSVLTIAAAFKDTVVCYKMPSTWIRMPLFEAESQKLHWAEGELWKIGVWGKSKSLIRWENSFFNTCIFFFYVYTSSCDCCQPYVFFPWGYCKIGIWTSYMKHRSEVSLRSFVLILGECSEQMLIGLY